MFGAPKPTGFGAPFGTSTAFGATPFGAATPASTSAFGANAFSAQTPAASGSLFGTTSTANTGGLFSQPNTFGQSTGFTFGTTPSTSGGLFSQNTQSSSVFSTPNTFGTAGGFGSANTGGLFGTQNNAMASTSGASIFGSSVFGATNMPNGTTAKFVPVTGSDSMMKNGLNTNINTKHQCITSMKEYEQKSLEELRCDDYIADRKGKQQSTMFGATPVGGATAFSSFTQQGGAFGNTAGFGATSAAPSLFGNTQTPASSGGLFGQNKSIFGAATTTAPTFGFSNTSTPSLFGQPQAAKPLFGTATSTPATGLFGNTATSAFGTSAPFSFTSAASQPSTGIFGNKTPGFGTAAAPSLFGNAATAGTNLFNKPAATPFSFGATTSTTGFGNTSGSLFGNKTGFGTAATGLGTGTFGAGLGTAFNTAGSNSIFGNAAKAAPFGNAGTFGTLGGGAPAATTTTFGNQAVSSFGGNVDLMMAAQQAQLQQQLAALTQSPYGDSPLFWNLKNPQTKREDLVKPTNPAAQKAALNQYKVSPRPNNKIKPKLLQPVSNGNKSTVFDGTDDDDFCFGNSTFIPRKSIKKLVLRSRPSPGAGSVSGHEETNGYTHNGTQHSFTNNLSERLDVTESNDSLLRPLTPPPETSTSSQERREQQLDNTFGFYKPSNPVPSQNDTLNESQLSQDLDQSELPQVRDLPPHPTGIVMTRPDYYTIPSLDDLTTMMDNNGDIFVQNFTIGRENYGSVFFSDVTNVANLNIDDLVHFRRKEVIVYPDDDNKPPLGEGLNKPAEVTLDCVWPIDKTNKSTIKSPERLKTMKYADKIELATARIGAKFIDYRPETGSWIFAVKHFSKYGLVDDSDDEEVSEEELKRLLVLQQHKQQLNQQQAVPQTPMNQLLHQQMTQHASGQMSGQMSGQILGQATGQATASTASHVDVTSGTTETSTKGDDSKDDRGEPMTDDDDDVITGLIEEEMGDDISEPDEGLKMSPDKLSDDMEFDTEPSSHRLATGLGLDPHSVQSMKASLFDDNVQPMSYEPTLRASKSDTTMSPTLAHMADRQRGGLFSAAVFRQKHSAPMSTHRSASLTDTSKATMLNESMNTREKHPAHDYSVIENGLQHEVPLVKRTGGMRTTQLLPPIHDSFTHRSQHLLHDAGLFMGRSFRVGWGPGNTIIHSGQPISQVSGPDDQHTFSIFNGSSRVTTDSPWKVTMECVNITPYADHARDSMLAHHTELLEIQLKHSQRSLLLADHCPLYTPLIGVTTLHALAASSGQHHAETGPDSASVQHMHMVWHLCVSLWGNIPGFQYDDDTTECIYAHQQARREAFSDWLTMVSSDKIKEDIRLATSQGQGYLYMMLAFLSGGRIVDACALAQRESDHRLALLISQACGSDFQRQVLAKQIMNWAENGADEYITSERLKIYSLLASHLVWVASDKTVNCCETMDWKRALALHLWYMCKSNATITEAISEYDAAYVGDSPHGVYAVAPLPPYMEHSHVPQPVSVKKCDPLLKDTCYHVMKLYTVRSYSMDRVLCPDASTANQLDYRLSWHLCSVLLSLGYTHISENRLCVIHLSYASQLESLGLWHWAVFVLTHIENTFRRRQAVREVLNRNIGLSGELADTERERFVTDQLGVPVEWIHYAKALRAKYCGLPDKEAWHLLKAGQWNSAHTVILKHLAAEAVINEELDYLKSLLLELCSVERSCSIQNWVFGGSVYMDYIQLIERLAAVQQGEPSVYELEKLEPQVVSLCSRVGNVECYTAKHRLCQLEMSKKSANLLRTLMALQHDTLPENVPVSILAPHISKLPMSEDYSMQELRAHDNAMILLQA